MSASELCVIKTNLKLNLVEKFNRMTTLPEEIILWYLPTASGFRSVILCASGTMIRAKGRYHLKNQKS